MKIYLAILTLVLTACEKQPEEVHFTYPEGSDDIGHEPLGMCWLASPHTTLVLGTLLSPRTGHASPHCSDPSPYIDGYAEMEFSIQRTAGDAEIQGPITVLAMYTWNDSIGELEVGDQALMSLRVSEGEAFVMNLVPVVATANGQGAPRSSGGTYDLPNTWTGLVTEYADYAERHEVACTEVWAEGPGGSKRMSDAEFGAWIRTDPECQPKPDPDLVEEPVDGMP